MPRSPYFYGVKLKIKFVHNCSKKKSTVISVKGHGKIEDKICPFLPEKKSQHIHGAPFKLTGCLKKGKSGPW